MKRFVVVLAVLLLASTSWAADLKSIGNTTDAAITTGTGYLKGMIVHTDGTNSVTFAVYDHATAASGSKLFSTLTVTTSAANRATTISFEDQECPYFNGIYVDLTTSGSVTYDVYFKSN
jgi:hypothetical protein